MKLSAVVAPLVSVLLLSASTHPALAQAARSMPVTEPMVTSIPDARDVPFPGTVTLDIDATDTERGLYRVKQTFPVPDGADRMILQLPEWLPGNHAPRGPIKLIADIHFAVDGEEVGWRRDPLEVNAFHIALPPGAQEVTARFIHTSPLQSNEGRITMTQEMLNLQWEKMSLYPAGHYVRQITFAPTVTLPEGWMAFTALDGMAHDGNRVSWDPVDYETLVDSPIFAGEHSRVWDLGHGVTLNAVADEPELLEIEPRHLDTYRKLVDESLALFGARHFDHYEFLLALTDRLGGIGLEHHRSSENTYGPRTFVDWDSTGHARNVVSHEIVHSWNGKFRRPELLWTPDYRRPMQDNLLWMYEGQTQFWGWVLAARSGMQDKEIVLGAIANSAGYYAEQPGRAWRSVEDTTHDPIITARTPLPFSTLSRAEDYYSEGMMVWLEADQIIREGTDGARGLDDFVSAFFGVRDGDWGQLTYDFDEIAQTLDAVYAYDWAGFLRDKFQTPGQPAPLEGVRMAGYELVWRDEPNPYEKGRMGSSNYISLMYSLGVSLDSAGKVTSTMWDGPAFNAGMVDGTKIVAVSGEAYSEKRIKAAIAAAATSGEPIELIVQRGDRFMTLDIPYHGGLRWPWLERVSEGEPGLDRLLAPRTQ